ncbi:MAG: twin-arginine translocase TatA/TatE family subunit [Nitrospirales bacterium]|nr:twin-arginine translocase TatA/TatE family subunit [Nitrospirales bacterium]
MFGLGAMEVLVILVIAFLLFGPKELPEIGKQVGKAVKGFKDTTEDLRQSVEPEINMITQEFKSVEQDLETSMKEAEEQIKGATEQATDSGGSKAV